MLDYWLVKFESRVLPISIGDGHISCHTLGWRKISPNWFESKLCHYYGSMVRANFYKIEY